MTKKSIRFKPLTDLEVMTYAKRLGLKNFSVYAIDELNHVIKPDECGIVNYQSRLQQGTHWVCYYNNQNSFSAVYVDSFGTPPPKIIEKFLIESGKDIEYNMSEIQQTSSIMCGWYCLYFLYHLQAGQPLDQIVAQFDILNRDKNEKLIKKFAKTVMTKKNI